MISPFLRFLFFFFFIIIGMVGAQPNNNNSNNPADSQANTGDSVSNFQPSLAVVIGMLSIMFSLTFILLLYAKFCHRASSSSVHTISHQIHDSLIRSSRARTASGLDKTLVESLPFFRFSSLKGSRHGLECAVCLAKFEDVEVLRLLPKCKHAFHIDCIDQWLDKHSTCPLCRHRVTPDDLSRLPFSTSLRHLWTQNDRHDSASGLDLDLDLYVEREESRHGSLRFSIGGSFRKGKGKGKGDEECTPIPQSMDAEEAPSPYSNQQPLHKLNHRIVVSDVVLKNRWSNVSSSDLMFLSSEMLNYTSSARFSSLDYRNININISQGPGKANSKEEEEEIRENDEVMNIKEEMERKMMFESKLKEISQFNTNGPIGGILPLPGLQVETRTQTQTQTPMLMLNQEEGKRSMSEIIVHPRFHDQSNSKTTNKDSSVIMGRNVKEERRRRMWLPIATKTVQWFANRERIRTQEQQRQHRSPSASNV